MTGLLIFVKQASTFQAACGACIACAFLVNVTYTWPYKQLIDNILKAVAEAQLFLTLMIRCD